MQLMTFNEILTKLCDDFDELIAPKTIARRNTNIIYLIFKAIAKGYEVINNVCVVLSHKFDPAYCSVEDLNSVASLVGTERLKGSASGLHIIITNNTEDTKTLVPGTYTYKLDEDVSFYFDIIESVAIEPSGFVDYIAMTDKIGKFYVTEQADITVMSNTAQGIPAGIVFSCKDNSALLGIYEETDLEFRERILGDTTRQNSLQELEIALKNLPYLFDASIKYNETDSNVAFDGYTIPPAHMAIFYSGELKNEIAQVVASKVICPTVSTENSNTVYYRNSIFINEDYPVHLIPFGRTEYDIEVIYNIDETYISDFEARNKIKTFLLSKLVAEKHVDFIKEDDIYLLLKSLEITGIDILSINLYYEDTQVDYIYVLSTRIPVLNDVSFSREN